MQQLLHFIYCRPLYQIVLAMLLGLLVWTILSKLIPQKIWKHINRILFAVSAFGILFATIIHRSPMEGRELILQPFHFINEAKVNVEMYRSVLMNSFLFFPLGLTMPFALPDKIKHRFSLTALFALLVSFAAESIQYIWNIGRAETDDVIFNVLGALFGCISFLVFSKVLSSENTKEEEILTPSQKTFLNIVSSAMSGTDCDIPSDSDLAYICNESIYQATSLIVYDKLSQKVISPKLSKLQNYTRSIVMKNIHVQYYHGVVHKLMTENDIPYVIIKGMASAAYYRNPFLRTFGDVDLLVPEEYFSKASEILSQNVFKRIDDSDEGIHIAFSTPERITIELHRSINGLPDGTAGDICRDYLSTIFSTAQKLHDEESNVDMMVPDTFHHGFIILLHTASHMISSGIGLRHLCDWSAFISTLDSTKFCEIFEEPLKKCGMWEFAEILTQTCVKYLGAAKAAWTKKANDKLIDQIAYDILDGGNFGQKDQDRFRQIKYIANRGEHTVDSKGTLAQLSDTISKKAESEGKSRIKVLLDYAQMLIKKERKPDSAKTISAANERKEIYRQFHLFDNEKKK